jgi:hypothetical protein
MRRQQVSRFSTWTYLLLSAIKPIDSFSLCHSKNGASKCVAASSSRGEPAGGPKIWLRRLGEMRRRWDVPNQA